MQNADIYSVVNKKTGKYSNILEVLKTHEQLLNWDPEETVLDAGCGPGDVTAFALQEWLPSDFRYVLGMDVSSEMIKYAQATFSSNKLEFATFDMDSDGPEGLLSGKYSSGFDKVFSFYTLHWLKTLERGLECFYYLMKPGGQALVTFPIDRYFQKSFKIVHAKEEWRIFFKNIDRQLPPFPSTNDAATEFKNVLETVGFDVSKCEVRDNYCYFHTVDEFKGLLESVNPDVGCIPANLKDKYLNDCFIVMKDMNAIRVEGNSVRQRKMMLTSIFKKPKFE